MTPNPFLLAADNSPDLLPLLRSNPELASSQDEHGYSLVHAAASYNHLDLLRALVTEFKVNVDLQDEDKETALFVVETVDAAQVLVNELGADIKHRGAEGLTAKEKMEVEAEFPAVARYLASLDVGPEDEEIRATAAATMPEIIPPPPEGLEVTLGTMDQSTEVPAEVDLDFRRRIEDLAQRDDFNTATGQAELRRLVEDAVTGQGLADERNVKSKQN